MTCIIGERANTYEHVLPLFAVFEQIKHTQYDEEERKDAGERRRKDRPDRRAYTSDQIGDIVADIYPARYKPRKKLIERARDVMHTAVLHHPRREILGLGEYDRADKEERHAKDNDKEQHREKRRKPASAACDAPVEPAEAWVKHRRKCK